MAELPDGFDLAALLAPLPGEVPQGTDLREDFSAQSPYFRLRDARSEARDAEKAADRGEEARDAMPLWRTVRDLGMKCLAETSKDLEVAAWMTEALLRLSGLRGLISLHHRPSVRCLPDRRWRHTTAKRRSLLFRALRGLLRYTGRDVRQALNRAACGA